MKITLQTKQDHRIVYLDGLPIKAFSLYNDNAYNEAKDYARKLLTAKAYTPIFEITTDRYIELQQEYEVIDFDIVNKTIICRDKDSNLTDIFDITGCYIKTVKE